MTDFLELVALIGMVLSALGFVIFVSATLTVLPGRYGASEPLLEHAALIATPIYLSGILLSAILLALLR